MKRTVLALTLLAAPATAGAQCMDAATLLQILADRYEEVPITRGLSASGQVVVMLANRETGTWTLLAVKPDGEACGIAAGEAFEIQRGHLPPNG